MSPGQTFERVYLELKRQLREGTRPPGAPLEPTAIGDELGTSFTPVRDALHRLVGEGLVENPRHNGFAVPHPTEQALRDLYAWNGELLAMMSGHTKHGPNADIVPQEPAGDFAGTTAALFFAIAAASGNREHIRAITQLNDRLAPYRRVEREVFLDAENELDGLDWLTKSSQHSVLSRAISRYHKRRAAAAPQLLAALSMY